MVQALWGLSCKALSGGVVVVTMVHGLGGLSQVSRSLRENVRKSRFVFFFRRAVSLARQNLCKFRPMLNSPPVPGKQRIRLRQPWHKRAAVPLTGVPFDKQIAAVNEKHLAAHTARARCASGVVSLAHNDLYGADGYVKKQRQTTVNRQADVD